MNVGLHQGSALSPFLFVVVMDVLSESLNDNKVREMLYADDIALLADNEALLQHRIEVWQKEIERKGLRVNAKKTQVLLSVRKESESVNTYDRSGVKLSQVNHFRYLGSVISENGGCLDDVKTRVRAAWSKWKDMSGIVCDRKMPERLKVKVYKTVIRPVLLYGCQLWALKKCEGELLERTEMRMLRWMLGVRRLDKISNERIRKRAGVVGLKEKMQEYRLRWLGHVHRMDECNPVKDVWITSVEGKRLQGRPRLRWRDVVVRDMCDRGLCIADASDRERWQKNIRSGESQHMFPCTV